MESLTCTVPFKQALTPVNLCHVTSVSDAGLLHGLPQLFGPHPARSGVFFEQCGPCHDTTVREEGNHAQARLWIKLSECRPAEDGGTLDSWHCLEQLAWSQRDIGYWCVYWCVSVLLNNRVQHCSVMTARSFYIYVLSRL